MINTDIYLLISYASLFLQFENVSEIAKLHIIMKHTQTFFTA